MSAKFLIIVALAACAYAAEEERVKKDVLLGTIGAAVPYTTYTAIPYSYAARYDDTKYYPGKYQKTVVAAPTLTAYHVPQAAVAPLAAPVAPVVAPSTISAYSTHSVHPVPYASYPTYPYHYSGYPFVKSYVYQ